MDQLLHLLLKVSLRINFSHFLKDITTKVAIIQSNYKTFPEVKGGLISFIEHEEKLKLQRLNGDNPKEAPDPKWKKYESSKALKTSKFSSF